MKARPTRRRQAAPSKDSSGPGNTLIRVDSSIDEIAKQALAAAREAEAKARAAKERDAPSAPTTKNR